MMFESDLDTFVMNYLLDSVRQREPSSVQMSLGSAFDAFVKNALMKHTDPALTEPGKDFHLETLFNKQVSEEHQGWAWVEGKYLFDKYKEYGAYDQLLEDLEGRQSPVYFEREAMASVKMPDGRYVPFRGYPDGWYRNREGRLVILDWKCNGFRANNKHSPKKYFVIIRPKNEPHKFVTPVTKYGMNVQDQFCFSKTDEKWAAQLTIYSWLLGEPIVNDTVLQIEQVLMGAGEESPDVRIATYRGFTTPEFQTTLAERIQTAWIVINSGHIYRNTTREKSDERIKQLERRATAMFDDNPILQIVREANKR